MTKFNPASLSLRGRWITALLAFVIWHSAPVLAAPSASVIAIEPTRLADLVLLRGGFDAGLRQGMVCRVTRGTAEIAEVLLVELRPAFSAALILSITPKQSIRSGDVASIKILKT